MWQRWEGNKRLRLVLDGLEPYGSEYVGLMSRRDVNRIEDDHKNRRLTYLSGTNFEVEASGDRISDTDDEETALRGGKSYKMNYQSIGDFRMYLFRFKIAFQVRIINKRCSPWPRPRGWRKTNRRSRLP